MLCSNADVSRKQLKLAVRGPVLTGRSAPTVRGPAVIRPLCVAEGEWVARTTDNSVRETTRVVARSQPDASGVNASPCAGGRAEGRGGDRRSRSCPWRHTTRRARRGDGTDSVASLVGGRETRL